MKLKTMNPTLALNFNSMNTNLLIVYVVKIHYVHIGLTYWSYILVNHLMINHTFEFYILLRKEENHARIIQLSIFGARGK